ncbi:MAG: protein kinase, partial [Oscillospiraceae bacterium]
NRSLMKSRGMAHIQTVLDVFYENNTCYTVFEFINGISLKTYLANSSGCMSWEQVKEIFPPILTTLSLVHSAGIIHRGISPQTIFVTDKMELRLAGFAISAARTTNTEIACEVYTGFAAPEQYTNEINGTWTDVYGIAAVLYRCLTGTNPQEAIARTAGSLPEPMMINRNVPANVSKVIMQGLRLSPESRIRNITEFVDLLFAQPKYVPDKGGARESGKPVNAKQAKQLKKQKKERAKTIAVLVVVGIVLIAFAVVFAMTLNGSLSPNPAPDESSSVSTTAPVPETNEPEQTTTTAATEPEPVEPDANISVPDFTNRRYETTITRYDGIFTFIPTYEYSDEYSAGMMYDQSVEPDTMVAAGIQIEIKVSKGRSLVPLPEYSELTVSDYISELSRQNIKYSIETKRTNEVKNGMVAGCSKNVGDLVNVEDGETITVYIAQNYVEPQPDEPQPDEPQPDETTYEETAEEAAGEMTGTEEV